MKKALLLFILTILQTTNAIAQNNSVKHSLGGTIGTPGIHLGLSYKADFQNNFVIILDASVGTCEFHYTTIHETMPRPEYDYNSFWWTISLFSTTLTPIFTYNKSFGKQLEWYIGGGPKLGICGIRHDGREMQIGGLLCVGVEWHSANKPIDVAFDIRPSASAYLDTENKYSPCGLFDFPVTVSIRKRF